MLDIKLIMENPEKVKKALLKRMDHVDFTDLIRWEGKRKYLIFESESLKAEKNTVFDLYRGQRGLHLYQNVRIADSSNAVLFSQLIRV